MAVENPEQNLKRLYAPEDEASINKQLDLLMDKARADKWKVAGTEHSEWAKLMDLYVGGDRHWNNYHGCIGKAWRVSYNKAGRNIALKLGLITDMDLGAEVQPAEPTKEIAAYLVDAAVKATWDSRHIPMRLKEPELDAMVFGTGAAKVFWNYEIDDNDLAPLPIESVFVAPGVSDTTRDRCPYMAIKTKMSIAEAEHRWGLKGLKDSTVPSTDEVDIRETGGAETVIATELGKNMSAAGETQPSTSTSYAPGRHLYDPNRDDKVEVQEWYIDDPDKAKYKRGRFIIRVGKRIVEDKPNPYAHGQWPIVFFREDIVAHRVWGDSTLRQAAALQRELNVMRSLVVYNTHTQTTAITYTFPGGIPKNKLQRSLGMPGAVETINNANLKPLRDYPNPLPQTIVQQCQELEDALDKTMRVQEVMPPGSRGWPSSGQVVEQMRESQQVEIRETAGNFADSIVRVVELMASNVQQFYNKDRYAKLVGPLPQALEGMLDPKTNEPIVVSEGNDLHYVKINPENLKGSVGVTVVESTRRPLSYRAQLDALKLLKDMFSDDVTVEDVPKDLGIKTLPNILRRYRMKMAPPKAPAGGPGGPAPGGAPPMPGAPPPMQGPMPGGAPPPMPQQPGVM